jgi:hypothetical protein
MALLGAHPIRSEAVQVDSAQKARSEQPTEKPAARPVTIAADGSVTVVASASNPLSLGAVLNDISTHRKMPIVVSETVADARVTIELGGVSVDEALKRLLAPYDVFYLYSAEGKKPGAIQAVWVHRRGEGRDLEPVPPAMWASTKELEGRVDDSDPGVRIEAIEALIDRQGERSLPVVLRGLADADDGVRLGTLAAALEAGVDIASTDLHALVLSDSLQGIRLLALEAIETRPEAMAIAESVKEDQDEVVRNTARLLLERLESQTKKPPR